MLAFCTILTAAGREDKPTPNNQIAPFLGIWELDVKDTKTTKTW